MKNAKTALTGAVASCIILAVILVVSIAISSSSLETKDRQISSLQSALNQTQTEINTQKQQIATLQNTNQTSQSALIEEKNQQITELSNQLANLQNQITDLNTQITTLNNQLQTQQNQTAQTPTPEAIRDLALNYIRLNHPETEKFMQTFNWTGERTTTQGTVGAETYLYQSSGWKITISYPVIPNPTYTIDADYSATGISIPYRVIWEGTCQNQTVKETSYTFAQ
jgi:cell division protein FtsB